MPRVCLWKEWLKHRDRGIQPWDGVGKQVLMSAELSTPGLGGDTFCFAVWSLFRSSICASVITASHTCICTLAFSNKCQSLHLWFYKYLQQLLINTLTPMCVCQYEPPTHTHTHTLTPTATDPKYGVKRGLRKYDMKDWCLKQHVIGSFYMEQLFWCDPTWQEVTPSSVMTVYSSIVNSSSASDEGCLTDPSTGFLITPTVIVPSEDPPIKLSVSSFPLTLQRLYQDFSPSNLLYFVGDLFLPAAHGIGMHSALGVITSHLVSSLWLHLSSIYFQCDIFFLPSH